MVKISVIIPCYNVSSYLDRCLASVVSQSIGLSELEIICVNDASTDDTLAVLQKWEENYPENIMVISYDQNQMLGNTRNIGFSYATGDYVFFLDSDDWLEQDCMSHLYEKAAGYDCDVVSSPLYRDANLDPIPLSSVRTGKEDRFLVVHSEEEQKLLFHLQSLPSCACAKLIRREFMEENNMFFPLYLAYEDHFWGKFLHLYAKRAYVLEEYLYHYYVNPNSLVLKMDASHHPDLLTVELQFLQEAKRRGIYDKFRDEIEFELLFSCYISFLKILAFRYTKPEYQLYIFARNMMMEQFPNFRANPYLRKGEISEFHLLLLTSLDHEFTQKEFDALLEAIRKIGL